jgi:hypothetical protein
LHQAGHGRIDLAQHGHGDAQRVCIRVGEQPHDRWEGISEPRDRRVEGVPQFRPPAEMAYEAQRVERLDQPFVVALGAPSGALDRRHPQLVGGVHLPVGVQEQKGAGDRSVK